MADDPTVDPREDDRWLANDAVEEPVIRISRVNHYFGQGESRKQVLYDNNLEIGPGQFVIMTGPSGSGKTTLLTLIGALRSVQEGSVRVLGHELGQLRSKQLVAVRRNIGFIFQLHNLFDSLTAFENVKLAMQLHAYGAREMRKRGTDILSRLGLSDRVNYTPRALSGGQRQRVAIARALVNHPKLILADEPTAALDRKSGRDVVDLLKDMTQNEQATVLLVTHDNRILDVADRIINMIDGQIATDVVVDESARICEFLKKSETMSFLSPSELFEVARKMGREHHLPETEIIRQGDVGEKFYLIAKGTVDVSVKENGQSRIVSSLNEGDCFGELALISGEPRSATVISREPVMLYTLDRETFRATLESNESFRDQLLKVFFQRQ